MKVYQALPELLRREGVDVVFSMLGGTNVPWVAEGVRTGAFELIKARHEEVSAHAAAGYYRATGKVGVFTVTAGPGFANSVQGLVVAKHAHIPVIMIVSQWPAPGKWRDTEVDQAGICERVGAGFHPVVEPSELRRQFHAAVQAAYRNGSPQVISVGHGLLTHDIAPAPLADEAPTDLTKLRVAAGSAGIVAAVDALAGSSAPLILAGQGAVVAGAKDALVALAEVTGARLATTLRANRLFDGHPSYLGICGGWSPPSARKLITASDVVLAVGAALSERTTMHGELFAGAQVIHCEVDEERTTYASRPELTLRGDAGATAEALLREWRRRSLPPRSPSGEVPSFAVLQAEIRGVDIGHDSARGLDLRDVYLAFDRRLPPDRVVVTDSGRVLSGCTLVRTQDAATFVLGRGYGTVGVGLGTAVGAAVGHRGRPTVLFCGDGGFMMAISALDSARLHDLDLSVVILNDEQLGSEVKYLKKYQLPFDTIRQELPDVEVLARAYGGRGHVIRTVAELEAVPVAQPGITLYDCRLDPLVDPPAMFGMA